MTDLYFPGSILRENADIVLQENKGNGSEPAQIADAIVSAQFTNYQRLTDPTIKYMDRPIEDRTDISAWRQSGITEGLRAGQYQLVTEQPAQNGLAEGPKVVSALNDELSQRTQQTGVQSNRPTLVYDNTQVEPYRFDRSANALFINQAQLNGNVDRAALNATLDIREDRSPERLKQELRAPALAYAEENLPPAYDRAADRVKVQAEKEGWAEDKPRLRDAMVEAAYPLYRDATDPANPAATEKARSKFLSREGVTEVSEDFHPEIGQMAARGTATLNNPATGQNYTPPTVAIVEGEFAKTGSPGRYDKETDTVILDAAFVRDKPEALEGIINHELGHRYQYTPEILKAQLHGRYSHDLKIPPDPKMLEFARQSELGADGAGAMVVGAAEMKKDLNQASDWSENQGKIIRAEKAKSPATSAPGVAIPSSPNTPPKLDEMHPTLEKRNAHLDALLATEGVEKKDFKPEPDVSIKRVEEEGPSTSPANRPVPQLETSASR